MGRDVHTKTMKKLHFGCGGMNLGGWENHDAEVDIRKPLPFPNGSASRIFAEHVLEHVTHQEAWRFLEECFRVLAPNGVVRIAIPDVERMFSNMTMDYQQAVQKDVGGDGSFKAAIKAAVFEHGHQAAWTQEMLFTFMESIGFEAFDRDAGFSKFPDLVGVEQHGKTVGEHIARVETSVVEGVKPAC